MDRIIFINTVILPFRQCNDLPIIFRNHRIPISSYNRVTLRSPLNKLIVSCIVFSMLITDPCQTLSQVRTSKGFHENQRDECLHEWHLPPHFQTRIDCSNDFHRVPRTSNVTSTSGSNTRSSYEWNDKSGSNGEVSVGRHSTKNVFNEHGMEEGRYSS